MTPSEQAVGVAAISASITTILILAAIWWILLIVARWRIFTKAGEAGWKSIIPIYADYVQWRIGWKKTSMFWIMIGLVILGYILCFAGGAVAYNAAGKLAATGSIGFLAIIGLICVIVAAIIGLIATYKLFASYGKGVGWFILYILFNAIMLLALGFGSSQYQGAQD